MKLIESRVRSNKNFNTPDNTLPLAMLDEKGFWKYNPEYRRALVEHGYMKDKRVNYP